jgi:hypothetical protein
MPHENTVRFECRHCGQCIEASVELVGVEIDCPSCGKKAKVQPVVARADTSPAKPEQGSVMRCMIPLICLIPGLNDSANHIEKVVRCTILLICLIPLLWIDYVIWKQGGQTLFESARREILIFFFLVWIVVAWFCTPSDERGRFGAVLGCGIMAVSWWGLKSIPCVVFGAVVLLFGLTNMIMRVISAGRTR